MNKRRRVLEELESLARETSESPSLRRDHASKNARSKPIANDAHSTVPSTTTIAPRFDERPPHQRQGEPTSSLATTGATKSWEEMRLKPALLRGILAMGFKSPSLIQQRAVEPIVRGRDVLAQSQSGTGKTAVFCIAALQIIKEEVRAPQALILSPTRELAEQTARVLAKLSDFMVGVTTHACVGGTALKDDVRALKSSQVISGTPGRVYDTLKRGALDPSLVSLLVVDEADEMITNGFQRTITAIYTEHLSRGVQVVLVSATVSKEVSALARDLLLNDRDCVRILVRREETPVKAIAQYRLDLEGEEAKFEALCDLYARMAVSQGVVFCNTRAGVERLAERLTRAKFTVGKMHGDMPQREREEVMARFRSGAARVLVATDVFGRGIDVQQVSVVVNYDVPDEKELYVHRVGRAGRFGRKGVAITLVSREHKTGGESDAEKLARVERYYGVELNPLPRGFMG